jgi:hypothetical protein
MGGTSPCCTIVTAPRALLDTLLESFSDIFEESCELPLVRRHDHRIQLLPGMAPMVVRPYRYPQLLKDEVERQCDEMLRQGIIRRSHPQSCWSRNMMAHGVSASTTAS